MNIEFTLSLLLFSTAVSSEVFITDSGYIKYSGTISRKKNELVEKLYNKAKTKPKRIIVSSEGGDVEAGMELGTWIIKNELDVEIGSYCISSCANYVFLAGKKKILNAKSLLGWHGGVLQRSDLPFMDNNYLKDVSALTNNCETRELKEKYKKNLQFHFKENFNEILNNECNFFKEIGTDYSIILIGHHMKYYSRIVGFDLWSYRIEALINLGVKDIVLKDGEWLPPEDIDGKTIFYFSVKDLSFMNVKGSQVD